MRKINEGYGYGYGEEWENEDEKNEDEIGASDSVFHSKRKKNRKQKRKEKGGTENQSTESRKYNVEGVITQSFPNAMFRACLESEQKDEILVYAAGNLRRKKIHILLGDRVLISIDKADRTKGRIIQRLRREEEIKSF